MFAENWDDPDSTPPPLPTSNKISEDRGGGFKPASSTQSKYEESSWRNHKKFDGGDNFRQRKKWNRDDRSNKTYMKVESGKIGRVIGRQGSKINELQGLTNTKIKIGDYCEEDNYLRYVIISGNEESQKECQKLIEALLTDRPVRVEYGAVKETLPVIDWDALHAMAEKAESEKWAKCPPIRKNFYVEHPEVANMSKEEVEAFRQENFNIVVKHVFGEEEKILNPVQTFSQAFQNYPDVLKEIEKQGFQNPSPIQCQAWPILLSGKDLIGIAQTGTGKTLAFLLPALIHIEGQQIPRSVRGGANVLIIAPTRELALQIEKEVQKYSYKGIKSVCVYGGGGRRNQMTLVFKGVAIIIATPGRLIDFVEARVIDLSSVTYIVLDEADRLLDMGFEPQIRKILLEIRPDRQSVMTSATWSPRVQALAEKYMSNPVQVYVGSLDLAVVSSVSQTVLVVRIEEKKDYLLDFIHNLSENDKVIIFVSRKVVADDLSCDLSLYNILCQCIHGKREQADREQALDDLKTGDVRILIATDVASRGIDISDITKVFNYDLPRNIEDYVHRVGRTGRAGRTGEAVTLFTRHDWALAGELITILEEANQPVPQELYKIKEKFLAMQKRSQNEEGGRPERRRRFENDFSRNYS